MKPIRLSSHAENYISKRGFSIAEVIETISSSEWQQLENNRLECKKDFVYNEQWNNRFYKIKQVRPVFVEEENEIVVITVYTYYF
ncbi:MAG: DUF4258 domain-containing protein [Ignavibacteriales bacterium]|nr:MAG: DUF4258 domain-containing protein [Ignavibacteriales bacterium]